MSRAPDVRTLMNSSGTSRPASVNALRMAATFGPKMVFRLSRHHSFESADGGDRALEARHHVAREQLVALQRLLARGPLVRPEEQAAEAAAGQLDQPLDALDGQLGRSDERRAHLHPFGERVVGPAGRPPQRLLEVGHGLVPLALVHLAHGELVILGQMHVDDEPPLVAVHRLAVHGRRVLADLPVLGEGLGPAGQARAEREHAEAVLARGGDAGRREHARHGDGEMRVGVRREVEPRLVQLEPVGLHRDRPVALEQGHDRVERLVHALALRAGLDAHHVGVRHERPGPAPQHGAPARHVVELDEAVGDEQRMVIRQAGHARAEHDVTGALGGGPDHDLRRGDQLPARGMMLADPRLVVPEVIEPLDQLHVAGEGERGILAHAVEGSQEDAELHSAVRHDVSSAAGICSSMRVGSTSLAQTTKGSDAAAAVMRMTGARSAVLRAVTGVAGGRARVDTPARRYYDWSPNQ